MINKIWFILILLGIIYAVFTNNIEAINNSILTSGKKTIDIMMFLIPNLVLWNGIMFVASNSGLLNKISKLTLPFLSKLFPNIPKNHKSLEYISSNIVVNMAGLSSAATPIGLKAMKELQKLNKDKKVATKEMITFIVLNTTGLTIIPTTIIALRASFNSSNPTSIVVPTLVATILCSLFGLILDKIHRRNYDKYK